MLVCCVCRVGSPICLEELFSSTLPVNFLRCGHAIHVSCLDRMLYQPDQTAQYWRCPTCKRSIDRDPRNDAHIASYLLECPMPDEYAAWRAVILCNDCLVQSELSYHFAYHRCPESQCGSYNTDVLKVKRIEAGSEEDEKWRGSQAAGRLPSAYERARAAGVDANSALERGWRQIREEKDESDSELDEDDEDEDEKEEQMVDEALAQATSNLTAGVSSTGSENVEAERDDAGDEAERMEPHDYHVRERWQE